MAKIDAETPMPFPETWAFSPAAQLCPPLVAFVPEEPFATHRPAKGGWVGGRSQASLWIPLENGALIHGGLMMTRNLKKNDCRWGVIFCISNVHLRVRSRNIGMSLVYIDICVYVYMYSIYIYTLYTHCMQCNVQPQPQPSHKIQFEGTEMLWGHH